MEQVIILKTIDQIKTTSGKHVFRFSLVCNYCGSISLKKIPLTGKMKSLDYYIQLT